MIDRGKLRGKLRNLSKESTYMLLDRAIDLIAPTQLNRLIEGYFHPEDLVADQTTVSSLLDDVKAFYAASLRGEYYEEFDVTYKNCDEKSRGTVVFIADCHRLLDRCVTATRERRHAEAREAFEVIFGLLREISRFERDILFFADEGGVWALGVNWREVLPAWFKCLTGAVESDEYARLVRSAVDDFAKFDHERLLEAARQIGTPEQERALGKSTA